MADTIPPIPGNTAPSSNRNIMVVLSYLWLLALVPLLTEKEDKEVQWHAKHGIVLMVAEIVLWVVVTMLTFMPFMGCLVGIVGLFVWLGIIVLHIMCIVKGVNGQRLTIPGLSEFAEKF
jgi:uncharacterized membrane protein